jgi:hypothetical protein
MSTIVIVVLVLLLLKCIAHLAAQCQLGILPQRGTGLSLLILIILA